jgi:hypothetical protein
MKEKVSFVHSTGACDQAMLLATIIAKRETESTVMSFAMKKISLQPQCTFMQHQQKTKLSRYQVKKQSLTLEIPEVETSRLLFLKNQSIEPL